MSEENLDNQEFEDQENEGDEIKDEITYLPGMYRELVSRLCFVCNSGTCCSIYQ